jgi:hypothetical protein
MYGSLEPHEAEMLVGLLAHVAQALDTEPVRVGVA